MISPQAKQGVERIFFKSAKSRLIVNTDDVCEIKPLSANKAGNFQENNIIALTISSFTFRLMVVFHVDENPVTRSYFAGDANDKPFTEVFAELGNLCCGSMNNELQAHFYDLGMSTPTTLSSECASFFALLKPNYLSRYAITINESVQLHATLCMTNYGPVDFVANTAEAEDNSGELELF